MTVLPSRLASTGAIARAITSLLPPGGKGTTMRIRPGASCALTGKVAKTNRKRAVRMAIPLGHGDVEKRRVLLRAEHVGFARTAARARAADGELDGVARLVHDKVRDARGLDAVEHGHGLARDHAGIAHALEVLALAENDVERDVVDARVLRANRGGELAQLGAHGVTSSRAFASTRW